MPVMGDGESRVLFVLEYPTSKDDFHGKLLHKWDSKNPLMDTCDSLGIDLYQDCWITTALNCAPVQVKPERKHAQYCSPNLWKTIDALKPRVIITLGELATFAVTSRSWVRKFGTWDRWGAGWRIPDQKLRAWVCPVTSPYWVQSASRRYRTAPANFRRLVGDAFKCRTRELPDGADYRSQVTLVMDPDKAARIIRAETAKGGLTAFDYECNCLNPQKDRATILSCAICFRGSKTIAYPWSGAAIQATKEYLKSDCKKIACNMGFEQNWSRFQVGTRVKNFFWDTMQGAHWEDNTKDITSIKFQSYVRLGAGTYNDKVEVAIKSAGDGYNNLATEVTQHELLMYNGLDSLLEFKVALIQMDENGIRYTI